MADIVLHKPPPGHHVTIPAHAGARFVVKFDTSEATPKKDGVNFIFTFEDGSSLTIKNFYGVPNSELSPHNDTELFAQNIQNLSLPEVLQRLGIEENNHAEPTQMAMQEQGEAHLSIRADNDFPLTQDFFITFS